MQCFDGLFTSFHEGADFTEEQPASDGGATDAVGVVGSEYSRARTLRS